MTVMVRRAYGMEEGDKASTEGLILDLARSLSEIPRMSSGNSLAVEIPSRTSLEEVVSVLSVICSKSMYIAGMSVPLCKAKRQYLLTCKVSRCCPSALHCSIQNLHAFDPSSFTSIIYGMIDAYRKYYTCFTHH